MAQGWRLNYALLPTDHGNACRSKRTVRHTNRSVGGGATRLAFRVRDCITFTLLRKNRRPLCPLIAFCSRPSSVLMFPVFKAMKLLQRALFGNVSENHEKSIHRVCFCHGRHPYVENLATHHSFHRKRISASKGLF
jgi:hypothetical protein